MGTFRVGCKVVNILNPRKTATVEKLLVDTGSDYTWLPGQVLERIGINRVKKDIQLIMANGQTITRTVGYAIVRCGKFETVDGKRYWDVASFGVGVTTENESGTQLV